jgi:hypothetical protein
MQSTRKSIWCFPQQLNFGASSTYRIIWDVKLFLYKIQMQQALHEVNKACKIDVFMALRCFWKEIQKYPETHCDEMTESRNRAVISQVTNCKSLHDNS